MSQFLFPLLKAMFGGLGGEAKFEAGFPVETLISSDPEAIEAFVLDHTDDNIYAYLTTTSGERSLRAFYCTDWDKVDAVIEANGDPWIAITLVCTEEQILLYAGTTVAPSEFEVNAIPLPGYGGWDLPPTFLDRLTSGDVTEPAPVEVLNDAQVLGGLPPDDVQNLPLMIGLGKFRDDKKWPSKDMTYGNFLAMMSVHKVGDKNGPAFIQGETAAGERKSNAMKSLCVMGLDFDSGVHIEDVIARIQEVGLTGVIYTTHSNMGTTTFVTDNTYAQFAKRQRIEEDTPQLENIKRFMREDKHWEQWVVDTIEIAANEDGDLLREQTGEGVGWHLKHAPIPKFRVVFPLAEPYKFVDQRMSSTDAIKQWKGKVLGLANTLGFTVDLSCTDPARLFYLPRHKKGSPFATYIINGALLDFDSIPNTNEVPKEDAKDVFEAAGEALASDPSLVVNGANLKSWAMKLGRTFDIVKLFRDVAPSHVRNDDNTTKIEVECPFEYRHSNAGDDTDRGCYAVSATEGGMGAGFQFGCLHSSCKGDDRLSMVAEAINKGWFTRDDIYNEDFKVFEETPVEVFDVEKMLAESTALLTKMKSREASANLSVISTMFRGLIKAGAKNFELDQLVTTITENKLLTNAKKVLAAEKQKFKAGTPADELNKKIAASAGIHFKDPKLFVVNGDKSGYIPQKMFLLKQFDEMNKGHTPNVFDYGCVRHAVTFSDEQDEPSVERLDWTHLANFAQRNNGIFFVKENEDEYSSVALPDKILSELITDSNWTTPKLLNFADLPFFNADGIVVREPGYDKKSQVFLKPSAAARRLTFPQHPTEQQVKDSVDFIMGECFDQFPWDDGPDHQHTNGAGSKASFLAFLLMPFIQEMINGPRPLYLVSKPSAGTGATTLLECALFIMTGQNARSQTMDPSEEEQRKSITTAFAGGKSYYWLDNVKGVLRSPAYCNLATAAVWEDRLLGGNKMATYLNKMIFIIAGNNARGTKEIMRRAFTSMLDAKIDPTKRDESVFRHNPLQKFIKENHDKILTCLFTIIQSWIVNGKVMFRDKDRSLASFGSWTQITGGILQNAGVDGFLSNLHLTAQLSDDETAAFVALYGTMFAKLKDANGWFSAHEVAELYTGQDNENTFPQLGFRWNHESRVLAASFDQLFRQKIGQHVDIVLNGVVTDVSLARKVDAEGQTVYSLIKAAPAKTE